MQNELRMSLFEHLAELRSRLVKCTIAVLVLGLASLIFAKPIFGLLMAPVLRALPPGNRNLIYTSGIEEINVLMKVGLYCGIFLTTPVIPQRSSRSSAWPRSLPRLRRLGARWCG